MAFPLFGKKVPPAPLVGKTVARPPAKPAEAKDDLGSLDFTQPGDLPGGGPQIEVREDENMVPAAIEQAAMLYSVEQVEAACAPLEAAIRDQGKELGNYVHRAWGMLFELYQLLGRQNAFEHLALEYAARFESSPPTWAAISAEQVKTTSPGAGRNTVSLSGQLTAKAADAVKSLLALADKNPSVRLELAKLTDADEAGCALINDALRQLKKARKECVLGGADKLAVVLARKTVMGQRDNEAVWMLLLNLYQQLGNQEAFEDAAVNYAVTFEVSPPSWEPVRAKADKPSGAVTDDHAGDALPEAEPDDLCVLEGCITAAQEQAFATIRTRAESKREIVVDVSRLQRMDFVSAANLMNLATALAASQKTLRVIKASHLLLALWEVIGLNHVARIELRKS